MQITHAAPPRSALATWSSPELQTAWRIATLVGAPWVLAGGLEVPTVELWSELVRRGVSSPHRA